MFEDSDSLFGRRQLMKAKNAIFCILFFLLLTPFGMSIPRQQNESKRKQVLVKGRIIGYSMRSRLRSVQGRAISPPHDAFIFLVEWGNEELRHEKHIKVQYRATPQHHEDLPSALFEESSQRSFVLEKDETCDELMESFIYGDEFESKESSVEAAKRFPNLARLRGAENILLPAEQALRCYNFEWDSIEK